MNSFKPTADDFELAQSDVHIEQLSRPSLSYWQDAWIRLKKNTRAIISLYIVVGLAIFTILGPSIWRVDPALQDLNQISQPPSWPKTAILVGPYQKSNPVYIDGFPAEPDEYLDDIPAPDNIRTIDDPTTQRVRIQWDPVEGAGGYNIYRNQRLPEGINDLGLPLGSTLAGNAVSYEDRLNLESRAYYYSIVSTDGFDESYSYNTFEVMPQLAITFEEAKTRGLIDAEEQPAEGSEITLGFHPLGTDYLGRDMLARLMEGARVSLFIGICAPFLFVMFGIFYGGFAGYIGGKLDQVLMRFADFVVALPFLLFMILFKISFGIGPGESGLFLCSFALVLLGWPATARLVRGQVLQIREQGFIEAARLLGAKNHYLITRHIIPNNNGRHFGDPHLCSASRIFTEAFCHLLAWVSRHHAFLGVRCVTRV